ncbi:NAD(P)/FAD-dependent oxidoreductase [Coralloluteibacterium stylophorae]|uniref:FAD-dependent monooxygenase n=1 Tax=Coralloluteibacterium stylophorae TaxID=1776034 RepID=A0A8J8AZQ2_9GAMM|nr:FAD-dependent monooxygenase [Coralloluteibacterium stylophorae]MBS7458755.1 FAD-dependent monooxygenase [Coralloluteibacterium stylophorae]
MRDADECDVAILGGGLAGLTLAIQLKRRFEAIDVRVVERRRHPVAEAAFKVGESTVEIGAHYLAETLGLRAHLDAEHLRKFGFRFFFSDRCEVLDACTELGVDDYLAMPSWQIDRGRLENFLGEHARALGVAFEDGASVRGFELSETDAPHRIAWRREGTDQALHARWLVDASGRAGLVRRQRGLDVPNAHRANAAWFRVDGWIGVDEWCADGDWRGRCSQAHRWRSTNHLVGPGYWVWMIPLSSGAHSIGIVADAGMHPLESMNSLDKALDWLGVHQPRIARALEPVRGRVRDFLFLRDYSYGCSQVFSGARWALTGEAGLFLDPFYSPGTDFIAIANTYICDLVARDREGEDIAPWAALWQQMYFSFYESMLALYQDQYPLFGNPRVMPAKVIWDYTYYWGVLCPLVLGGRLTELSTLSRLRPVLARARELNAAMQATLRAWHESDTAGAGDGAPIMLNQARLDWFVALNRRMAEAVDAATFVARIDQNLATLERLADEIRAEAGLGPAPRAGAPALLPPAWYGRGSATAAA